MGAVWNGKEVSYEEYWKLRLLSVAENVTKENLTALLLDLDMDEIGSSLYQSNEE